MKNLREKIMAASFGKLFRRWFIAALCVALLGGGVSGALLAPQIGEAVTAVQTAQQQKDQWKRSYFVYGRYHGKEHRDWLEAEDIFLAGISRPSNAAAASVGVTALLSGLLALAFCLLSAAWLYQAAVRSGMSGTLRKGIGLLRGISAALLAAVRSLLGRKCPACGSWQDKKAAYCAVCGSAMSRKCPDCGADCPAGFHFCSACGMNLGTAGAEGGEKC